MHKALLILDDRILREQLSRGLSRLGIEVGAAPGPNGVLDGCRNRRLALAVLGAGAGAEWDELDLAREVHNADAEVRLILVTLRSSEERAIAALRAGVHDYFVAPCPAEPVIASCRRLLAPAMRLAREHLDAAAATGEADCGMVCANPVMEALKVYLWKVAATDCNVLLTGETGTGKEVAAQLIHRHSPRHDAPFVCINCAAIPDSLFESELFGHERGAFTGAHATYPGKLRLAEGGTVFLDEIGEMSPQAQAKLLRVLESREVYPLGGRRRVALDVRVVAATNQTLDRLAAGSLRRDLYYRLSVAHVHLPALKDRKEAIPHLLEYYLHHFNVRARRPVCGFSLEALSLLMSYDWPGNVRELRNVVESLFIDPPGTAIAVADLPVHLRSWPGDSDSTRLAERERLLAALIATNWNKSKAAEQLRWSRMTLYRKMVKYQVVRGPVR